MNNVDPSGLFIASMNLSISLFITALVIKYIVQPIILAAVILTTIYVITKLTQGPPKTPVLVSAVEKFKDVINNHHDDILQYAIDHNIEDVVNKGGIPPIPKVVESYRLGLLSEYFGDLNTNFITKEIYVNHWYLTDEQPSEVELVILLGHEYGHLLYGHKQNPLFKGDMQNEEEAMEFQDFFFELYNEDN